MEEEGGGGGIIEEIVAAITSILAPSVYFAIFQRVWKYRLRCLPYQLVSLLVVRHILVPKPGKGCRSRQYLRSYAPSVSRLGRGHVVQSKSRNS